MLRGGGEVSEAHGHGPGQARHREDLHHVPRPPFERARSLTERARRFFKLRSRRGVARRRAALSKVALFSSGLPPLVASQAGVFRARGQDSGYMKSASVLCPQLWPVAGSCTGDRVACPQPLHTAPSLLGPPFSEALGTDVGSRDLATFLYK